MILIACDDSGSGTQAGLQETREVFKLSVRGRRGSNAPKRHNANHLFSTFQAAENNRAHPGDRSRIVTVEISGERFNELLDNSNATVADLRDF